MAEDWAAVAAEVADAIAEVGFAAVLEKPGANTGPEWAPVIGAPTTSAITIIDDTINIVNLAGTLVTQEERVLTVSTAGLAPQKADRVQVRGIWHQISRVTPIAPGGVDLMYEVRLV